MQIEQMKQPQSAGDRFNDYTQNENQILKNFEEQFFSKIVPEVNQFIAYNHFKPIVISKKNLLPKQNILEYTEDSFEPLSQYNIWKIEKLIFNNQLENVPILIGTIKMISKNELEEIVNSREVNLDKIFDNFVKEIKGVVIKANKTQLQIARIFAATFYRDCWRISFIMFNRFRNVLKNFIIRNN